MHFDGNGAAVSTNKSESAAAFNREMTVAVSALGPLG
jgi:hypothetical protein